MSVVIYGETNLQINKQKSCAHQRLHGPCIDEISRYCKCLDCYCLIRDLGRKEAEEYYSKDLIDEYSVQPYDNVDGE
jgi:hypothetical protein